MVTLASAIASHHGDVLATDGFAAAPQPASHSAPTPGTMRPVPKFGGTSIRDPHRTAQPSGAAHQLQWRTSGEVAPPPAPAAGALPVVAAQAGLRKTDPAAPVAAAGTLANLETTTASDARPATNAHGLKPNGLKPNGLHPNGLQPNGLQQNAFASAQQQPVRQVQLQTPQSIPAPLSPPTPEPGLQLPPGLEAPPTADRALPDFFADPFGERSAPDPATPEAAPRSETLPPPLMLPPAQPPLLENELRDPTEPAQPVPLFPEPEASPFELRPTPTPGVEDLRPRQIEDFEMPRRGEDRRPAVPVDPEEDITLIRPVAFSCDDFRQSIAEATIQRLSLDISPPFRPDVIELDEFRQLKERFNERQESRDWQSIDGRKLGRGRMRDLAYEKVIIETDFGTLEELPVNRLSEDDLAYVSSQWGLPQECLIEQPEYQSRTWIASQITWKASNLVHKPLYFEDVNLERYGHTAGPFLQPVVSSAHFFVNIAVMPYKMGVHSPHECQYALGYYRPGNCAPWITPPVPLSLRGALFQAAAVTGNVLLIP